MWNPTATAATLPLQSEHCAEKLAVVCCSATGMCLAQNHFCHQLAQHTILWLHSQAQNFCNCTARTPKDLFAGICDCWNLRLLPRDHCQALQTVVMCLWCCQIAACSTQSMETSSQMQNRWALRQLVKLIRESLAASSLSQL